MARANAAYYARHDPFQDFVTAPEITQVFGELIGAWAAVMWEGLGRPDPVVLAECGPGRGTLMQDALRLAARVAPGFRAAAQLHLVETSPALRRAQAERLPGAVWHDRIADLPGGPMILVANEFLDALPIRQFVRRADGWAERFVAGGAFAECLVPPKEWDALMDPPPANGPDGAIWESNEAGCAVVAHLAARLAAEGGGALIIDYGPEHSATGDSLQALRHGRPADPLADPGMADLTAHVDFAALARTAVGRGAAVFGPVPQGAFLTRLGLFPRAHRLARALPPQRAMATIAAASRLAEPDQMGRLFKVLALCHPAAPQPPGFEEQAA